MGILDLQQVGSNLSKQLPIEVFLDFPRQTLAEQARNQIQSEGFEAEVKPAAQSTSWLRFATKQIVPGLGTMQKIRKQFNALATSLGGEYDEWGKPVVD